MKQTILIKSLLAAASLLGFAATVQAQDPLPTSGSMGLLGQTYAGLEYSHINLHNAPVNAENFGFEYNQALNTGLDGLLTYDLGQTGLHLSERAKQQTLGGALRAFSTSYSWGKPFVEAGVGYTWTKSAGIKENSFVWEVAVGSEFQIAPKATVTPYVRYSDAPDLAGSGTWNYGVKANYWVTSQWSVTAGINYDDDKDTAFSVGTNFRF